MEVFDKNVQLWLYSIQKYIWDMMAVKVGERDVMAVPLSQKSAWEEWSARAVAQTLETVSRYTLIATTRQFRCMPNQGMEYPMICWNYGRPEEAGSYSDRVKFGMISVIIHEIGHNYFPMIVNQMSANGVGWMRV